MHILRIQCRWIVNGSTFWYNFQLSNLLGDFFSRLENSYPPKKNQWEKIVKKDFLLNTFSTSLPSSIGHRIILYQVCSCQLTVNYFIVIICEYDAGKDRHGSMWATTQMGIINWVFVCKLKEARGTDENVYPRLTLQRLYY